MNVLEGIGLLVVLTALSVILPLAGAAFLFFLRVLWGILRGEIKWYPAAYYEARALMRRSRPGMTWREEREALRPYRRYRGHGYY